MFCSLLPTLHVCDTYVSTTELWKMELLENCWNYQCCSLKQFQNVALSKYLLLLLLVASKKGKGSKG